MPKKRKKADNPILEKVIKILISSAIGIALAVCFLLSSSALVLRNDFSESVQSILAFLSFALSAFAAGFISGKLLHKSGIVYGAVCTVPMCLFLMILCAVLYGNLGGKYVLCCVLMLLLGAIGGISAVNVRRKRRYR